MSTPYRGRGGGRGRGRGGALVNFRETALDYDQIAASPRSTPSTYNDTKSAGSTNNKDLHYQSPIPRSPYAASPSASTNQSPAASGYSTPRKGIAYAPASGSSSRGSARGNSNNDRGFANSFGRGGRGSLDASFRGGRGGGRGRGGSNGIGFSVPREAGGGGAISGEVRPFLVPVRFVKASALPMGLEGDDDELLVQAAALAKLGVPGELDDQVKSGGLLEVVRELELDSDTTSDEEQLIEALQLVGESSDNSDVEVEVSLLHERTMDQRSTKSTSPALDLSTLYVSDLRPSPPPLSSNIPSHSLPALVLGLASNAADDSDSDEEIVFVPVAPSSIVAPSLSKATTISISQAVVPVDTLVIVSEEDRPVAKAKQVKLTSGQKRALKIAGKKARKAGTDHTRSGNRHLLDQLLLDESMDLDSEVEVSAPRVDDSDLEWGDNGPDLRERSGQGSKGRSGEKRAARKVEREQSREVQRIERLSIGARQEVSFEMGEDPASSVLAAGVDKYENIFVERRGSGRRSSNRAGLDEAAADYARNVMGFDVSDEDGGAVVEIDDMSFLTRNDGQQVSIADLQDSARALADSQENGGWQTESDSEDLADSDDELEMDIALGEADALVDLAMAIEEDAMMDEDGSSDSSLSSTTSSIEIEAALLSGATVRFSSMGLAGPGGRRDKKAKKRGKKGKAKLMVSSDSDDSSDDEMFDGKGKGRTWADNDEDYIRGVQDILDENSAILSGRDRKNKKELLNAIENGDFRGYDFDDDEDMNIASGSKSRASARSKIGGGAFAASLQSQWADDRKKKGEYKRARAEARVAAEDAAPWLSKKSARPPPATAGVSSSDVSIINTKIRHFLMHELGQSSISLPPMSKRSRVAVHLLAEVYNLKSKSMGSGKSRFPLLQRGPNSGVFGVDERRVRAIIGTTAGDPSYPNSSSFGGGRKAVGKMGGLWAALTGDTKKNGGRGSGGGGGGGDSSRKNREGAVVGQGADRLGEGNVGYELLKRMGWTAGTQIGVSGGISEPISARIKTNKSGLGSGGGFGVSQSDAWKLAASDDWKSKSKLGAQDW